ncbi:MAG: hypothetical protein M1370_00945 [Bacteroidetes bacterium]|nr:hypothetical protein [Bacteroidota bacterium]
MSTLPVHRLRFLKALGTVVLLGIVLASSLLPGGAARAAPLDWKISNGWFYTQAAGGQAEGFAVTDDGGITFWQAFSEMGGPESLGYPVSWRYVGEGGYIYQAFQAGVLQWQPSQRQAVLTNTFELMQKANKDNFLAARGVPKPIADDGARGDWQKAKAARLGWLTNDVIRGYYLHSPIPQLADTWTEDDAINLYGLPMSKPVRSGPFLVQRFQRIALQLWLGDVPNMPSAGTVVRVLGGDLLKDAGLLPLDSLRPLAADSPYLRIDPALRRPLDILYGSKVGRHLVEIIEENHVPVVMEQSDNVTRPAYFQYFKKGGEVFSESASIHLNTRWYGSDPKALAAILAHEATHADIFFTRVVPGGDELPCPDEERQAYSTGAQLWQELYGPRGKLTPADDLDRELNLELRYRDTPDFTRAIERVCRESGRR